MADFVLRVEAEVRSAANDLLDVGFVLFDAEAEIPGKEGIRAVLNAGINDEARFGERATQLGEHVLDLLNRVNFVERMFEVDIGGVEIAQSRDGGFGDCFEVFNEPVQEARS